MAVSFVASTSLTLADNEAESGTNTFVTATTPSGIADGDTILAFLFARSTITPPAGWTAIGTTTVLTGFSNTRCAVYSKDTVTSGNSSTGYTFDQASDARMGIVFGVFRGVDSIDDFQHNNTTATDTYQITPPTVTAVNSGEMIVCAGSTFYGAGSVTPTVPSSFTKFSGTTLSNYRLATGYRAVDAGQSNSGTVDLAPGLSGTLGTANGMIGVSLRLLPPAVSSNEGLVSAAGPLGAALALGEHSTAGLVSMPSIFGTSLTLGLHDFSALVDGLRSLYVMDLIDAEGGTVRAPISSWQATLQTEQQSYVQAVVPACAAYLDAINAAVEFAVSRRVTLSDGTPFEYEMARAPLTTSSIAQGTANYTATLSGYASTFAAPADPDAAFDRPLVNVRTVFSTTNSLRIRCAIDWLLRPGQRALLNDVPLIVGYINYYVGQGDAYMDVGELVA